MLLSTYYSTDDDYAFKDWWAPQLQLARKMLFFWIFAMKTSIGGVYKCNR